MKFKLYSLVLLLVCFVFLGVLAGVIPVQDRDAVAVFGPSLEADGSLSPAPSGTEPPSPAAATATARAVVIPTPRMVGTAAPVSTGIIAAPTASPSETSGAPVRTTVSAGRSPTPSAEPTAAPAVTPDQEPMASPQPVSPANAQRTPAATAAPKASAAPTATPAPTAAPAPAPPTAAAPPVNAWEPDAEVISTTITWSDPLQNDTDLALDEQALAAREPALTLPAQGAQVLIIHTHGTEAYTPDGEDQYEASGDWRTIDTGHTVVRVGEALAQALESYGLRVIVDRELYDWPSYNGSYGRAEAAIRRYLEEDPGIAMVIDLHRDALGDNEVVYRTVSDQLDAPAAQMMFVVGTDENLDHPHWRENLTLAMRLQQLVEDKYPHLMRPTLVCPYRYNQQLTTGSVLLEVGTTGNTLQEAITAAELFAEAVGPELAARVGA